MRLKSENEILKAKVYNLEEEIISLRKALLDAKMIKEPIIFDGV